MLKINNADRSLVFVDLIVQFKEEESNLLLCERDFVHLLLDDVYLVL